MASVWLDEREWKDGQTPEICMRCGAPATHRIKKNVSWRPWWVYFFLGVPFAFVPLWIVETQRRRVVFRFCKRHRFQWLNRCLIIWGGLLVWLLWFCLVINASRFSPTGGFHGWVSDLLGIFFLATFAGWIILSATLTLTAIRAKDFKGPLIQLTNVAHSFVQACTDRIGSGFHHSEDIASKFWRDNPFE
jgi:hypothetical protein